VAAKTSTALRAGSALTFSWRLADPYPPLPQFSSTREVSSALGPQSLLLLAFCKEGWYPFQGLSHSLLKKTKERCQVGKLSDYRIAFKLEVPHDD